MHGEYRVDLVRFLFARRRGGVRTCAFWRPTSDAVSKKEVSSAGGGSPRAQACERFEAYLQKCLSLQEMANEAVASTRSTNAHALRRGREVYERFLAPAAPHPVHAAAKDCLLRGARAALKGSRKDAVRGVGRGPLEGAARRTRRASAQVQGAAGRRRGARHALPQREAGGRAPARAPERLRDEPARGAGSERREPAALVDDARRALVAATRDASSARR